MQHSDWLVNNVYTYITLVSQASFKKVIQQAARPVGKMRHVSQPELIDSGGTRTCTYINIVHCILELTFAPHPPESCKQFESEMMKEL